MRVRQVIGGMLVGVTIAGVSVLVIPDDPKPPVVRVTRCPEDAVRFRGACVAGDDFAQGTELRVAADGMLGVCEVGHAVVMVERGEVLGACTP